jgi:16S rRNA (cytosine967-C5)-methyltransferase
MSNKGSALPKPHKAPTARQTALQTLYAIEAQQAYTDVALRQALHHSALERRDRAFVTECVYGVLRWQGRIDWLLAQVYQRPLALLTPWIRNALRLGVYQCLWMTGVPHRAAVYETVELARRFGHAGTARLVNGVLRTLLRQYSTYALPDAATQPATHLAIAFSHPEWLVTRWLQRYGWERTRAICEANNRPGGVTLRSNTLRLTPEALAQRLHREGLQHTTLSSYAPAGLVVHGTDRLDALPSYREGLFQVQDEGAMLVAPLCDIRPGQDVLDACAAPGGKTTHMAQLLHNTGRVLACDVHRGRLRMLQNNAQRLGLSNIMAVVADTAQAVPVQGCVERVLIDAPCSGFGVLRRRPDMKWRKTLADLSAMQALQLQLLHTLHHILAAEGLLVYSVCSNEPEETHEVVRRFLAAHPQMQLVAVPETLVQRLPVPSATPGTLDLTPEQWHTDGVFVARFLRKDGP